MDADSLRGLPHEDVFTLLLPGISRDLLSSRLLKFVASFAGSDAEEGCPRTGEGVYGGGSVAGILVSTFTIGVVVVFVVVVTSDAAFACFAESATSTASGKATTFSSATGDGRLESEEIACSKTDGTSTPIVVSVSIARW